MLMGYVAHHKVYPRRVANKWQADIIAFSFPFFNGPVTTLADRVVEKGVLVTFAAGDYGANGAFMSGAGLGGENVLSVASVEAAQTNALGFLATFSLDGVSNTSLIAYQESMDPWSSTFFVDWAIMPLSLDTTV